MTQDTEQRDVDRPVPIKRFRFETIGTLVAMLVGVCALFIAWDQARILRTQTNAATLPIIQTNIKYQIDEGSPFIEYEVQNFGTGAAIIRDATFLIDGKPTAKLSELIQEGLPEPLNQLRNIRFGGTLQLSGVLAAGDSNRAIWIRWSETAGDDFIQYRRQVFFGEAKALDLEICYCSILGECWRARAGQTSLPDSVDLCPAAERDPVQSLINDKDFFGN